MSISVEASPNQFAERPLWQRLAVIGSLVASGAIIMSDTAACDPLPQRTLESPAGVEAPLLPVVEM